LFEDPPDSLDGGVGVVGGVLREELDDDVVAPVDYAEAVCECAAAVYIYCQLLSAGGSLSYLASPMAILMLGPCSLWGDMASVICLPFSLERGTV
jgi:hypothetical protein